MSQGGAASPGDDQLRAGARLLTLLAPPLQARIVRAHDDDFVSSIELAKRTGSPPQTTLRSAVRRLETAGLLIRRKGNGDNSSTVMTKLTEGGREARWVGEVLAAWLKRSPQAPITPESTKAKGAIRALSAGWSSTMVRELVQTPASLTELDERIPQFSYPSLERRLSWMRSIRQVAPASATDGRGTPYAVSDWLRSAVGPLAAAARCERRHMADDSAPITAVEIEAAFLLALPLVRLPAIAHGSCILSVVPEAPRDGGDGKRGGSRGSGVQAATSSGVEAVGVSIAIDRGRLVRCVPHLEPSAPSWALGTPKAWLNAVIEANLGKLRLGGARPQLPADLVNGLHLTLFGS